MKIRFLQTGGFAGLVKKAEIDCSKLSPEEFVFFHSLVLKSNFFEIPEPLLASKPDEEIYSITVELNELSRTIHTNKSNLPLSLKPLVDEIAKYSKYEKRKIEKR